MKTFLILFTALVVSGSDAFSQGRADKSSTPIQNRSLKIISKPRANYPKQDNGTICVTGVIRLRIRFLDSGKIGEINALNTLPYGITESAINAAQEIRFKPEIREGKAVTVTKVIEYSFSLY